MSIIRTIRRQFYKPSHRVTRSGPDFLVHRRFLRFFYRPCALFNSLDAVYDFVRHETKSDAICVEMYPPGDFLHRPGEYVFFDRDVRAAINSSGCALRALPPLPERGPTGPEKCKSSVTGPTGPFNPNCGPGPAPSEDNSTLLVAGALLTAAILSDDAPAAAAAAAAAAPTPDTNVPLEAPSPSPSYDSGSSSYDSGSSSYDSGSSCDSGGSSCDCGGGSC